MPDPLLTVTAIAAATGVAGGAAARLVERGVDAGTDWIKAHLSKHGAQVQQRAESNAAEFLIMLADRVTQIEHEVQQAALSQAQIDDRLSDPDFAVTLQNALIVAARTADTERHTILADLVADRLRHASEDIYAIVDAMAVEALPKLSRNQLSFLGLRHGIADLKYPRRSSEPAPESALEERVRALRTRFGDAENLDLTDFLHLASVACAVHGGGAITWSLDNVLSDHHWKGWDPFTHLQQFPDGLWLLGLWERGAERITLTLLGARIASYVFYSRDLAG